MKQKTLTVIVFLMLSVALLSGCEKVPPGPQAVAMNMATIAEAAGINEKMKKRSGEITQLFSEELKALSIDHRKEIEARRISLGENPSEQDEQEIQALEGQLKKQLIEFRKEGQARMRKEITEIRQSYFDDILSVAEMIALEHGASIILKKAGIFWSDSSVDITDEVSKRLSGAIDPRHADPVATDISGSVDDRQP